MGIFDKFLTNDAEKLAVWAKGHPCPNAFLMQREWRIDDNGNRIRFQDYGDRNSEYGWEIDHIKPVALGGSDDISNKRPLHWRANASAGGVLGALAGFRNR